MNGSFHSSRIYIGHFVLQVPTSRIASKLAFGFLLLLPLGEVTYVVCGSLFENLYDCEKAWFFLLWSAHRICYKVHGGYCCHNVSSDTIYACGIGLESHSLSSVVIIICVAIALENLYHDIFFLVGVFSTPLLSPVFPVCPSVSQSGPIYPPLAAVLGGWLSRHPASRGP